MRTAAIITTLAAVALAAPAASVARPASAASPCIFRYDTATGVDSRGNQITAVAAAGVDASGKAIPLPKAGPRWAWRIVHYAYDVYDEVWHNGTVPRSNWPNCPARVEIEQGFLPAAPSTVTFLR